MYWKAVWPFLNFVKMCSRLWLREGLSNLRKAESDLTVDVLQARVMLRYARYTLTASFSLTLLANFAETRFCEQHLLYTHCNCKIFHKIRKKRRYHGTWIKNNKGFVAIYDYHRLGNTVWRPHHAINMIASRDIQDWNRMQFRMGNFSALKEKAIDFFKFSMRQNTMNWNKGFWVLVILSIYWPKNTLENAIK